MVDASVTRGQMICYLYVAEAICESISRATEKLCGYVLTKGLDGDQPASVGGSLLLVRQLTGNL